MGERRVRLGWGPLANGRHADAADAFEWSGVTVSHWRATCGAGSDKGGRPLVRCVSACGVMMSFRRSDLAAGATATCEACRPGTGAPAAARVVPEGDLAAHRAAWRAIAVEIKCELNAAGLRAWEEFGLPAFLAFVDRTGLGRAFGWKVRLRDCHNRKPGAGEQAVRVRGWRDGSRSVDLGVRPADGPYWFEVDLATGRTDRPWPDVRKAIEHAVASQPEQVERPAAAAPAPPLPPLSPNPESILGGFDVDRLIKMRNGFDTLITVGKDVKECEAMKREAQAALAARRAEADPLKRAADAACEVAKRAFGAAVDAKELAQRLHNELQRAMSERERLAAESDAQAEARDRAMSAYAPARDAVAEAERHLAEVEQMEAERVKTLAQAGDVAVLLAALQKLGAA